MSATIGKHFTVTLFGESHGPGIGAVLDGLPAGFPLDMEELARHMHRRAPGGDSSSTPRKEADEVRILSGLYDGRTTGAPLSVLIENTDTRPSDYANLSYVVRPGHADYAAHARFGGHNDPRGGGMFSGRLTAPLVFAGSVARQILAQRGVTIGAHIAAVNGLQDTRFDPVALQAGTLSELWEQRFPLLDPAREAPMRACIDAARADGDSVGGLIECGAVGVPAGIGSPFFDSVESVFSRLAFSIPAVKSVEFGDGGDLADMRGSEANDSMHMENGCVRCGSNHNGGVTGGITNGMPVIVRIAVKPTPSIARPQQTVDLSSHTDTTLAIRGRHDPCIVPRAVPVVESALAIALLDLWMDASASSFSAERSRL